MKNLKSLKQKQTMLGEMITFVFGPAWSVIIMAIIPIKAACASLRDRKTAIANKLKLYEELLKSYAQDKEKARISLANYSFTIMSTVRSFAVKSGMTSVALQMKATSAGLIKLPFETLLSKTALAIDLTTPLLPQLVDYKISQSSIDLWIAKHKALSELMDNGSVAYKERTQLGDSIETDMSDTMTFFNTQFCPLFAVFMISQPDLFGSFMKIKRIGNPNIHHTRLLAQCLSELNVPYFGLTVQVDAYTTQGGKTYEAVIGLSNVDGYAEVSGFFPATRTVTISGPGVVTASFPAITFFKGKAIDKEFVMQPSSFNIPAPIQNKQKANS